MKRTRRQLSSIDRLPPEALPAVQKAMAELASRQQKDVLVDFNIDLERMGLGPISQSAFSRHALRVRQITMRTDEAREIGTALVAKLPAGTADDVTAAIAEMLKTLVMETLEAHYAGQPLEPKAVLDLAKALDHTLKASKVSTDRRVQIEDEARALAEEAIDTVAKAKGTSAATVDMLREAIGLKRDDTAAVPA